MLEHSLIPEIDNIEEMWYQQNGALPHTAHETIDYLKSVFGDRIISKKTKIKWPARSFDLSPLDFFLWGYLKDRVYQNRPETLDDLKTNIEYQISEITVRMLKNVMKSFYKRLLKCREREGRYLDNIIFHV